MSSDSVFTTEEIRKHPYDDRTYRVSFHPLLASGETIATVDAVDATLVKPTGGTGTLTSDDLAANAAIFELSDGTEVAIGKAAEFTLSGGAEDDEYHVSVEVTTSANAKLGANVVVHVD